MSKSNLKMVGNYGCYLDDDNVISFQIGDTPLSSVLDPDPMFPVLNDSNFPDMQWLQQSEVRRDRLRYQEESTTSSLDNQAG